MADPSIVAGAASLTATVTNTDLAPTPTPNDDNMWKQIVVSNFEDNGIVFCADALGAVYDTEDVYFGVKPARVIGSCVDGRFVPLATDAGASAGAPPNPSASTSVDSDSIASDTTNPSAPAPAAAEA